MKKLLFLISFILYFSLLGQAQNDEGYKQVDGAALYYKTMGKGEPVIVLPGGPGLDVSYLHPGIDPLSEKYQLITFDSRSTGKSKGELDTLKLTADKFVEDLEAMRHVLGLKKIHLMGHSYGGLLAMIYATKYPDHLYSLTLITSGAADPSYWQTQSKTADDRLSAEDKKAVKKMMAEGYFDTNEGRIELFNILWKPYVFDQEKIKLINNSVGENTFLVQKHVSQSTEGYELYDKLYQNLPLLSIPTLIIHGDYDPVPLEAAQRNHQAIRGSRLVILNNCGHFPFIEQKEIFINTVMDFLQSVNK